MASHGPERDPHPYQTPSSLASLAGPAAGVLTLPVAVDGGAGLSADLSTPDGVVGAYENLVREGTSQQQQEMLNADLLRAVWPQLRLPMRCRDLWQTRFPELAFIDAVDTARRHERPRRRPDHPKPGFHI